MISEKQQLKLRELHADGHSVKDIAETLQISQPTVRAYLKDKNRGVVKKENLEQDYLSKQIRMLLKIATSKEVITVNSFII
uniref:Resolvase HTH domain-containing protein n=1 Tax=uncultured prokaryote TaxID=198431 RepID=A0A0H5Q9C3_9ZZZZ|nr:hypothetical protein [uncultured prokaryote]